MQITTLQRFAIYREPFTGTIEYGQCRNPACGEEVSGDMLEEHKCKAYPKRTHGTQKLRLRGKVL